MLSPPLSLKRNLSQRTRKRVFLDSITEKAAAALLRKWHFQEEVVSPILYQDNPLQCGQARPLACLLHLVSQGIQDLSADKLADDPKSLRHALKPDTGFAAAINLTPKSLLEGLSESTKEFHAFSRSLVEEKC